MSKIVEKSIELSNSLFPSAYSEKNGYKCFHFAYLYRRNTLLSIGQNSYELSNKALYFGNKFSINNMKKWPSLHAEISAISKIWGREYIDSSIKMVVIRLNKNRELGNSKPCKSCSAVISVLGIDKVWYSTKSGIEYGI